MRRPPERARTEGSRCEVVALKEEPEGAGRGLHTCGELEDGGGRLDAGNVSQVANERRNGRYVRLGEVDGIKSLVDGLRSDFMPVDLPDAFAWGAVRPAEEERGR